MSGKGERATIHDVARVAGVSISSVSRALNGMTANLELVHRVKAAVLEVDYVPSALGQSLKSQKTGQVALAVPDISNASYLAMFAAAEAVFKERNLRVTLISTGGQSKDDIEVVRSLRQKFVDGLIITAIRPTQEFIEEVEASEVPVVVVGTVPGVVSFDVVSADSREAARLGVEHLVSQGASNLGLLGGPLDTVPGRTRYQGFVEAATSHGMFGEENLAILEDFRFDLGLVAARKLLESGVDGILAETDHLAVAVLHAARDLGLSVPLSVRVVGIDNSEVARLSIPRLTSIDLGSVERGRLAANFLLTRMEGLERAPTTTVVRPKIVVRESSL
jgi:LacI family transcriptional regulator